MALHIHDRVAKIVIMSIASSRQVEVEKELWVESVFADVVVYPGDPLPSWTGLLGSIIGSGYAVLEFYHGLPAVKDLLRAQAKVRLVCASMLRGRTAAGAMPLGTLIVATLGDPRLARRRVMGHLPTRLEQRGHRVYEDNPPVHWVDLKRLEVTPETALLHVAGNSPRKEEALALLYRQGKPGVMGVLDRIMKEVELMSVTKPETARDLDARERTELLKFGQLLASVKMEVQREEGLLTGRMAATRRAVLLFASGRFGESDDDLAKVLEQINDIEQLEALIKATSTIESLEVLRSQAKQLAADCISPTR